MSSLFEDVDFHGDIEDWDVSNVTNMNKMFYKSTFSGQSCDINKWGTKSLKTIDDIFLDSNFRANRKKVLVKYSRKYCRIRV